MEQHTTKQYVRVPADILSWPVSYTSRKVYIALLVFQLRARRHGSLRILKTYEQLAAMAGIANVKTVAACVRELTEGGYIQIKAHMYWSEDLKKLYRGTNEYAVVPMAARSTRYIWLPVKLLSARISPAAFSVCLFLLLKQGRNSRSWPSLRRGFQSICQKNGKAMPRKTVSDALRQLRRCLMVIVLPCLKRCRNAAYSMNTYMLTVFGSHNNTTPSAVFAVRGGYFFGGLPVKLKITKSLGIGKEKRFAFTKIYRKAAELAKFLRTALFGRPPIVDTG